MTKSVKKQENSFPKIVVILGLTAVGKSDLAVELAKKFNGEIISADSRQVYKGIDLLSGKITRKEMKGIKHYLLDIVSAKTILTVAEFKNLAEKKINGILEKGRLPIICGGTPFYIDFLINNPDIPEIAPDFKLRKKLEKLSIDELFKKLKKMDFVRAKNIDRYNRRRLIRALEIIIKTGKKISEVKNNPKYEVLKIGVNRKPEELKKRIEIRLLNRLKQGMAQEIKNLRKQGVSWKRFYDLGLECRYVSLFVKGNITQEQMIESLKKEIWHFVKRQMTWWKRDKQINWIFEPKKAFKLAKDFLK